MKKKLKKLIAMLSVASMLLTMLPSLAFAADANAIEPDDIVTADQLVAGNEIVAGLGKYQYGTNPSSAEVQDVSWIILDPSKTNMDTDGMFLISKNVLDTTYFKQDGSSNAYQGSDAQTWCTNFYTNTLQTVDNNLGNPIMATTKTDEVYISEQYSYKYSKSENILNNDKVFLPSAQEVDKDYLWKGQAGNSDRKASGANTWWWLRSPNDDDFDSAGFVSNGGEVYYYSVIYIDGARPALNLNPDSLIFKSISAGKYKVGNIQIDFDSQGGSEVKSDITCKGGKVAEPEAPTKQGFKFKGWYDAEAGGNKIYFGSTTFNGDTKLYAHWVENDNPGDIVSADHLVAGDEIVAGLGEYQYGECDCYYESSTGMIICNTHSSLEECQAATPIAWIILDSDNTNMVDASGEKKPGMFLLSRNVLGKTYFNENYDEKHNVYQGSDAQQWCTDFYDNALKSVDQSLGNPIMSTTKSDVEYTSQQWSANYAASNNILNGDKVFLPSAQEVDQDYQWQGQGDNSERAASGEGAWWWLRSPDKDDGNNAGSVFKFGEVYIDNVHYFIGSRSALNLNPESLIFKSISAGKYKVGNIRIDFDSQGGSEVKSDITCKGGKVAEPEAPTKEGYTFKGWYKAAEGGSPVDFATATFGEDTELHAQWTECEATLNYNASGLEGVTLPDSATMKYSAEAKAASVTAPEGYTFDGWYSNIALTGDKIKAGDTVKAANTEPTDTTLYAKWKSVLKFNANGGTMPSGKLDDIDMYKAGEVTIPNEEPTRADYDFLGWATSSTATAAEYAKGATYKADGTYAPDTTLYAVWKAIEPEVLDFRYYGASRYDTSIKVADALKTELGVDKFDCIVVATGDNYPDALAAGYLASKNKAPLILTAKSQEAVTAKYIKENLKSGGKIYLIGGEGAVSANFEKECKKLTNGVKRLGGTDRYSTNILILKEAGVGSEDILVCSGAGYADSLSASAAGKPIFLVGSSLTSAQKQYLASLSTSKYYAIGGTGAVSDKVFNEVCAIKSGAGKKRVSGANRYATSAAVAKEFFPQTDYVMLAYAKNFPDGLSGSPLASALHAPLLLTDDTNAGITAAKGYVSAAGGKYSVTLGGETLISNDSRDQIMSRGPRNQK